MCGISFGRNAESCIGMSLPPWMIMEPRLLGIQLKPKKRKFSCGPRADMRRYGNFPRKIDIGKGK